MKIEMTCPTCGSHDISKNGTTRRGKQNYKCLVVTTDKVWAKADLGVEVQVIR